MIKLDLAQFVAAVHTYAPKWEATSIRWQLTLGSEYEKRAAWVVCETGDMVGWFVIWTSGEAELEIGNLRSLRPCRPRRTHRPPGRSHPQADRADLTTLAV
ncbi:hypothetical protein ACFWMR_17745 [Amycolatopsis thailandensis]|uniref:hypothetical protein n=1 Tax=Amycolatopsis thailandensis TaxID=589330 RepID=UPI003646687E